MVSTNPIHLQPHKFLVVLFLRAFNISTFHDHNNVSVLCHYVPLTSLVRSVRICNPNQPPGGNDEQLS